MTQVRGGALMVGGQLNFLRIRVLKIADHVMIGESEVRVTRDYSPE